jgi:glyoxylase-like metal-dependent hydrolase (beta-lactamase superfamily II)
VELRASTLRAVLPDGVHRLELPTPFAIGPVSCYVLRGEPLTLVDPGPLREKTSAALDAGLRALGLAVEDAELVIVTHQHHDHAGLAADVVRRSGARLATSPRLAAYLAGYDRAMDRDDAYSVAMMRRHGIDDDVRGTLDDISRSFRRYCEGATVDVVVGDGEQIVAGGRAFTAFERPGHSPTDTIFADADGVLIGGDHLLEKVSSNPIAHVPIDDRDPVDVATRDPRRALVEYLASMRATAAMDVSIVLPGHGEPFADPRALVASREEMHARRARRILRAVDGTRTAADMIAALWRALPVTQHYLALSEVLGHLDVLEADGFVRALERDDGVVIWTRPPTPDHRRVRAARAAA